MLLGNIPSLLDITGMEMETRRKTPTLKSLSNKVAGLKTFMFSCEYCEIFRNTYFEEHLQTAASEKRKSFLFNVVN